MHKTCGIRDFVIWMHGYGNDNFNDFFFFFFYHLCVALSFSSAGAYVFFLYFLSAGIKGFLGFK